MTNGSLPCLSKSKDKIIDIGYLILPPFIRVSILLLILRGTLGQYPLKESVRVTPQRSTLFFPKETVIAQEPFGLLRINFA